MDRKVQRVAIGEGAFHNPPKAAYSEETKNLIKLLMEESKLSMMQRKTIQDAVNRGDSLPSTTPIAKKEKEQSDNVQVQYPSVWKRRSKDMILSSGAYEREQYRRTSPLPNKEKQKRHLACIMAYGKEMPPTPRETPALLRPKKLFPLPDDEDPFKDLVQGIRERIEFLHDMECLGLGKRYRPIIHQEIAQKIRLIESIDKSRTSEINNEIEKFKVERPPPKPFPLGELDDNY
ncbi:UPF0193 protein EVG1 homolog [Copidosoma floridanum]|uniref:UPF0193 protein EVG1 homolog n=1 Tax=Copidosoma floridanum TaxID=29053 RepID=UPI0006C9D9B8|nr:UPF0193 protein EVG1 homolog [Copidosoma floridanum]